MTCREEEDPLRGPVLLSSEVRHDSFGSALVDKAKEECGHELWKEDNEEKLHLH